MTHQRAGSYQAGFGYQRECSCGESFFGSAEDTLQRRENHISEMNKTNVKLFEPDVYSQQGHQAAMFAWDD